MGRAGLIWTWRFWRINEPSWCWTGFGFIGSFLDDDDDDDEQNLISRSRSADELLNHHISGSRKRFWFRLTSVTSSFRRHFLPEKFQNLPEMPSLQQIRTALEGSGQAHVLRFWSELGEEQREVLLQELGQLELQRLEEHCRAAAEAAAAAAASSGPDRDQNLEPVPTESMGSVRRSDPESLAGWEQEGNDQNQNPGHIRSDLSKTSGFIAIFYSGDVCACAPRLN